MIFIIQRIIKALTWRPRYPWYRASRWAPTSTARRTPLTTTRYYTENTAFTETFYANLRKTIHWTERIIASIEDTNAIDYCRVLRTTNPIYKGKPFYTFNDDVHTVSVPDDIDYDILLSEALKVRPDPTLPLENMGHRGKVLRFEYGVTTHDGAPASVGGFVDDADIPPIDTWFYVTKDFLYCWIPTPFVRKMQDAIDVEILDSYEWPEELSSGFKKNLQNNL